MGANGRIFSNKLTKKMLERELSKYYTKTTLDNQAINIRLDDITTSHRNVNSKTKTIEEKFPIFSSILHHKWDESYKPQCNKPLFN
jgi:hypothetical protein